MAKPTPETWAKAKALFTKGKSYREIGELLNIPFSTVRDKAKSGGWTKGELAQVIADTVKAEAAIRTLEPAQQDIVRNEVSKQLEGMEFYATHARKVVKMGMVAYSKDPTPIGMKTVLDGMKSGMQVEGIVPFYPNAQTINNANAQQTVQPIITTRVVDNGN
ncbi:hypothetical protein CCP3SC15_4650002 [Gammaproteobacteria bacterium]